MSYIDDFRKIINDESLLEMLTFILNGSNRIKIYYLLLNGIKSPTDLVLETEKSFPSISRSLSAMEMKKVVKCINPREKHGKLFELTSEAIKIQSILTNILNSKSKDRR